MAIGVPLGAGNVTSASSASASTISGNKPTNTVTGDLLIAFAYNQLSTAGTTTVPSGWSTVKALSNRNGGVYYFPVTDANSLPAAWTWSFSGAGRLCLTIFRMTGADLTNPIGTVGVQQAETNGNTSNIPGITPAGAASMLIAFSYLNYSAASTCTWTPPSGMTEIQSVNSPTTGNTSATDMAFQQLTSAAATGNKVFGQSPAPTNTAGALFEVKPSSAGNVAPVAGFSTSANNLQLTVTSTASDSDGSIASTDYDWGDGTTHGSTPNMSHTYASAGTYTVVQTVTDNLGATNSTSKSVTVSASNQAPVSKFDYSVNDKVVSVTSSASDPDGSIASTSYDWGDSSSGSSASHTYANYGTFTITQTVTDNAGATASSSKTITLVASATIAFPTGAGNVTSANVFSATTLSVAKPINTGGGDVLWCYAYGQAANSTFTVPSGWTLAKALTGRGGGLYYMVVTDPTTLPATWTWTTDTSGGRMMLTVFRSVGVDPSHVIQNTGSQGSTLDTPSVNAVTAYDWEIAALFVNYSAATTPTLTVPSGMAEILSQSTPTTGNTSGTSIAMQAVSGVGATGIKTFGCTPAPATMAAFGVTIKAKGTNAPPVAGFTNSVNDKVVTVASTATDADGTIASTSYNWGDGTTNSSSSHTYTNYGTYTIVQTVTDNSGATATASVNVTLAAVTTNPPVIFRTSGGVNQPGTAFYFDGTTKRILNANSYPTRFKATKVSDIFGTGKRWYALHRGGSYNHPEETLYGYQGCADLGARALEVSVQYSSDNTPWCFHDSTVDRTIATGQTGAISSFTDAQLATMTNKGSTAGGNTSQPARPIAKFVDVINAWTATHVLIVEDKTYTHTNAFLNMLDSYGTPDRPATERFIVKLDATGGDTARAAAAARGYQTWGYLFDANMGAAFTTALTRAYTMLGFDFNSSDATLLDAINRCVAVGIRPTGHIIITQAQRDRLIGLGMTGLMLANKFILPNFIPIGSVSNPNNTVVDNGDGTFTTTGNNLTDNGDGTVSIDDATTVDNGDGTLTTTA